MSDYPVCISVRHISHKYIDSKLIFKFSILQPTTDSALNNSYVFSIGKASAVFLANCGETDFCYLKHTLTEPKDINMNNLNTSIDFKKLNSKDFGKTFNLNINNPL